MSKSYNVLEFFLWGFFQVLLFIMGFTRSLFQKVKFLIYGNTYNKLVLVHKNHEKRYSKYTYTCTLNHNDIPLIFLHGPEYHQNKTKFLDNPHKYIEKRTHLTYAFANEDSVDITRDIEHFVYYFDEEHSITWRKIIGILSHHKGIDVSDVVFYSILTKDEIIVSNLDNKFSITGIN